MLIVDDYIGLNSRKIAATPARDRDREKKESQK
jgi:hypothetical protein